MWAIIPDKERRFILLFFSNIEILLLLMSLIFIHYLMAFDWLVNNWFPTLSKFTTANGIPSKTWSYIFSLTVITYPIFKVSFGYFSDSRVKDLINLYKRLISEKEISLLITYINKYHIKDIKKYLENISVDIPQDEVNTSNKFGAKTTKKKRRSHDIKRDKFASWVYIKIFQNEAFVLKAANDHPKLFAKAFKGMKTPKASNNRLVKHYFECLFNSKNLQFVNELRIFDEHDKSILELIRIKKVPILYSTLLYPKVAAANGIWFPIGEGGIKSLKYEEEQREFLRKEYDPDLVAEVKNQKIYIAVTFFDAMVRESIHRDSGSHMWLAYFKSFADCLIGIIPVSNEYDESKANPSFVYYIISRQFEVMIGWLQLAKNLNTDRRVVDTIRSLGWCLNSISVADDAKIPAKFLNGIIDSILTIYFEFSKHPENKATISARNWIEKMFNNPKHVDFGAPSVTQKYLTALENAWGGFDSYYYRGDEDNGSIERFDQKVLSPLGLTNNHIS